MEGTKEAAIARALGVSRRHVRNTTAEIREHFEKAGFE